MRNGAEVVRMGRFERPLNGFSARSLCRLGYMRRAPACKAARPREIRSALPLGAV